MKTETAPRKLKISILRYVFRAYNIAVVRGRRFI